MLYIAEAEVRSLLPMSEAVRLMGETFQALAAGTAVNQSRRRMMVPGGAVLHAMAGAAGQYFGTKIYSVQAKHGAYFFFHLFDSTNAKPLAIIEANYLGQIRTGAASGYATDLLSRKDAKILGVIGSGFQARAQLEAILEFRKLEQVRVWSRDPQRRENFAKECSDACGVPVIAVGTAEEAVKRADIVVTATSSKDPVIDCAWIAPGTHINAMGSNWAHRRELPAELIERADLIAVDSIEQSKLEAGDLILAWTAEDWNTPRLIELKNASGVERSAKAITIFKSNGLGVEDVTAGAYVYEQAMKKKLGREL